MHGAQGAVLGVKMKYIEGWTEKRIRAADYYRAKLRGVDGVRFLEAAPDRRHVYHIFAVFVKNRDDVVRKMQEAGIGVGIHYPIAVPLQKCFAELGHQLGEFPVSEQIAAEEMTLPVFPEITEAQMDEVVEALKKAIV